MYLDLSDCSSDEIPEEEVSKGDVLNEEDTEVYWHDISQKSSEFNKYLVDNWYARRKVISP